MAESSRTGSKRRSRRSPAHTRAIAILGGIMKVTAIPQDARGCGAAKLEHQAAVKIEPKSIRFRFTRRVRHDRLAQSRIRR